MTADRLTIEDEITAVRLDWLDAEARLVGVLPSATPPPGSGVRDLEALTAALELAEQAHHAYMTVIRKWAHLPAE